MIVPVISILKNDPIILPCLVEAVDGWLIIVVPPEDFTYCFCTEMKGAGIIFLSLYVIKAIVNNL
jgi:hypothetical protein